MKTHEVSTQWPLTLTSIRNNTWGNVSVLMFVFLLASFPSLPEICPTVAFSLSETLTVTMCDQI